ncbi:hypothetical protein RHGRI_033966 [Rhododendron griersonianum]|uniref:Uncharacterized protein n=1 Tax=Rhododendron griersonianum TaxID=479676 RepID=A0AAV6I1U2_9ERIC|nr:hypothetical protein RHGRI_033966 [Rhododendron griersonianum]
MKKTAEQGKNKEVLHEGESKKRKGSSDVIKGAEDPGQAKQSKKRKLLKSGPVFRYLSKEAKKKLTSFWRSTAATDSLWVGSRYETSIYADEVSHILEQEAIANSQKRVTGYLKERWQRLPIESKVRIEQDCPQQPPGDFVTDEVGSWQSQENKEVEQAEEEDCLAEDIHRKSEETSSKMKRKRGQSSSKMKGKSGENAYELRPRANVNRATMEKPGTRVTPTKRRQNQGEVQSKSKHNKKKLDGEGKQVTYRSNLQAMISWSFVQLMEDLPAMSNYNWSQAILDNLRKSVEAYPTKPKNVAGCVMLLLYWLCEKTNIIEQETQCSTVPRILKWNLPKLKKKLEGIESLDNLTNVQVKLLNDYILSSSLPFFLITIFLFLALYNWLFSFNK